MLRKHFVLVAYSLCFITC